MDEVCSDESDIEISIKPAFAPKFFKDLNYHLG